MRFVQIAKIISLALFGWCADVGQKEKIISLCANIQYTVEPRLSGPRLSGLFDYPDFFLWSQFFHEY